jgi:flagellar hook-associated protein 2
MSDISIPGVKSKYDTQRLIDDLMKVERIPKSRAEERLKAIQLQKTTWQDLNRRISSLRESSRSLFSFQNSFTERIASSGDESVLTGTASREALEETKSFTVKQTASADKFGSDALREDTKVPKGNYVFTVGDKTVKLSYGGGSIKDFVDALNKRGADTVRAQIVAVSSSTRVLVIESLKPGVSNRLVFSEAAEAFALSAGLVERSSSTRQDISKEAVSRFEKPLDPAKARSRDGVLHVDPGAEAALRLSSPVPAGGMVLELQVELSDRPAGESSTPKPPPGPAIPAVGSMQYEGIRIESASSEAALPEWTPPPIPPKLDDFKPLYLIDGSGRSIALPEVQSGTGFKTVTIPLPAYLDSFAGIGVRNGNTGRDVRVQSARVFDPAEVAGLRPKNPVETARDSILLMDGIEVTRPSNAISDLVPGLTLNLWNSSDKPVKLTVEPNRKAAKEALIELVGNYNRLMAELNILARPDDKILDEITYLEDEEKKKYVERLGLFQGDSTLSQLRTTLQRTMMDAYPTASGSNLLVSFGISTDSRRSGSYDASRLRGYIEIDESKLDKALKENFPVIRDTMGFDTDGDLIIDSGAAFKIDTLAKAYVETGGIVQIRTRTIDEQITRQKRDIENLETQLVRKEDDLKRKYGMMESALGQMERSSGAWENFNTQNQGN